MIKAEYLKEEQIGEKKNDWNIRKLGCKRWGL